MQFVMEYENGDICSSSEFGWNQLPRDKKVISFGVHDLFDNFYELKDYDIYFFSDEAMTLAGSKGKWIARMIGAFKFNGEGKLIRVTAEGPVEQTDVNYEDFKNTYAPNTFIINDKGENNGS